MAAGWNLTSGEVTNYSVGETELWELFNYVFSTSCKKRSTYKYGLIKAILDNLLNTTVSKRGMELTYIELFAKFAENYWNLITKYHIRQMRKTSQSSVSAIERIFQDTLSQYPMVKDLEFDSLSEKDRKKIIGLVSENCRKNVIGALYQDFSGKLYGFDLKDTGIWLHPASYEFMLKYKPEIEQLNYYSWARFLESINSDNAVVGLLGKLESSTPQRNNLSIYRRILQQEFETNNCFYCGKKLQGTPHVDHVIPWSFVKADHLWNFVLACPNCNTKKKDRLPTREGLSHLIVRNEKLSLIDKPYITVEFKGYSPDLLWRIWDYAKLSGIRVAER